MRITCACSSFLNVPTEDPVSRRTRLLGRAAFAFLVLPGVVAYLVPLLLAPVVDEAESWRWTGVLFLVGGTGALLRCARDFLVAGKGTLAPWTPPQRLVTVGLYRRSRNPMYLAVLVILVGWSVWFQSLALVTYAAVVGTAFHLRVVFYEEPRLDAAFGAQWLSYRDRVRRWL